MYLIISYLDFVGFDESSIQKSCCGIGGDYDFSMTKCVDFQKLQCVQIPKQKDWIGWNGIHMAQNAYKRP